MGGINGLEIYKLKAVTKQYTKLTIIEEMNLSIEDHSILGIIGESGAGKTTLLKILSGLESPTSGNLFYKNNEINEKNLSYLRKEATMLFQTPVFLRGNVFFNLAYGLRIRQYKENVIKNLIYDSLERVRLKGFENRNFTNLSGGEQQRVSLARALVLQPQVLLLDEPTSNLDPENSSIISDIIKEESKIRLIIIATHDYDQIRKLAERVIQLEKGKIVNDAKVESFVTDAQYADNIFTGYSRILEGVTLIDVGEGVNVAAAFNAIGRVVINISPEDIIISKNYVETSARNELKGNIISLEDLGNIIRLKVDVGKQFNVQITKKSLLEMELTVGSEVYLSFKASSVRLI